MKERPIIFSTPMVQAILEGRKTQTMRVIKKMPKTLPGWWKELYWASVGHFVKGAVQHCPYGKPGDLLWVRETFCVWSYDNNDVWYKASPISSQGWHNETLKNNGKKWKPSIHMPKKYARIWLEVTGVRVERVQEISHADAVAEGYKECEPNNYGTGSRARDWFACLWDSINGKKNGCSWAENPWVWIVEFKRVEGK